MDDRNVSVYRLFDAEDALLYVGITISPRERFAAHPADRPWWSKVARIEIDGGHTREEALRLEADAIRSEHPRYNCQHHPAPRPHGERFGRAAKAPADDVSIQLVAQEAAVYETAKAERDEAILAAHEAGHSLRTIAEAAGVSHQTVKNLLAVTSREMGTKG